MKVLDLFAGIGGFTLGLERAGFTTVAFCEIDSYAQKVLKKNWPGVPIYDDVRQITADRLISDGIRVDVITGGFPCQDLSLAGNQAGIEGERSGLWSECARLLGEVRPRYAIFENVTNLLSGERGDWFKRVLGDISALGYDAEWHCIPASAIGAHHHRDRVWIVAYPSGARSKTRSALRVGDDHQSRGNKRQPQSASQQKSVLLEDARYGQWRDAQSVFGRGDSQTKRSRNTSTVERSSENVADTNNTRDRASRRKVDENRKETIERWEEQSQFEFSGSSEDVANSDKQPAGRGRITRKISNKRGKPSSTKSESVQSENWQTHSNYTEQSGKDVADTLYAGLQRRLHWRQDKEWQGELGQLGCGSSAHRQSRKNQWDIEPDVGRVANGVPDRSHRLKCLGNAVVPPIPELIGHAILENERIDTEF